MSSSLSTHLVSGARSLLSAQLASEGFPVDSSELAVNQGWRQNLFFFSLLFFFVSVPHWEELRKTARRKIC